MRSLRGMVAPLIPQRVKTRLWLAGELRRGEPELLALPDLLTGPGVFVDVGANRGPYSAFAQRLGRDVVAFEPHPDVAAQLRVTLGRRGVVHEVALSDADGEAVLHVPFDVRGDADTRSSLEDDTDPDLEHREVRVRKATLDSFDLPRVAVLKVDVEGHEVAVLGGAGKTLARDRPAVIVEVEEGRPPGALRDVAAIFDGLGYSGWWIDAGRRRPIAEFDPAVRQRPGDRPRWGEPKPDRYVNNFLWLPTG